MLKKTYLVLCFIFSFFSDFAQFNAVPVFISGTEGYKTFRIPAIIYLKSGVLLAFCEGRVNNGADFGNIDIVMKRSNDKGKTWSGLQVVAENDSLQVCNPAPVVDNTDPLYPNGRVFIFYNTGNNNEEEILKGNGYKKVCYKTSSDGGLTWSDAVDITLQTHRPYQPQINPAYDFLQDWRYYANTPGHALQICKGKYKGRIYIAANHTAGKFITRYINGRAHGFYSDDHGKTFHISDDVKVEGTNESTAAELSNGKLMMNSRNQRGNIKARIVSISNDGGATWDTSYYDKNLPDPVNEGSLLNIGTKKGKMILAFSNTADTVKRDNLTLRISFDEGKSWEKNILIEKNPQPYENKIKDFTAYSDLVKLNRKTLGILYERANYSEIVFKIVKYR